MPAAAGLVLKRAGAALPATWSLGARFAGAGHARDRDIHRLPKNRHVGDRTAAAAGPGQYLNVL
jgi:hypothetical protein